MLRFCVSGGKYNSGHQPMKTCAQTALGKSVETFWEPLDAKMLNTNYFHSRNITLFPIKQISHDEVTLCPVFSMRNNPRGWVPSQQFFHFRKNQMCVWWLKHCQGQAFNGTFSPMSLSSSSRTVMGIGINISRTSSNFTSLQV